MSKKYGQNERVTEEVVRELLKQADGIESLNGKIDGNYNEQVRLGELFDEPVKFGQKAPDFMSKFSTTDYLFIVEVKREDKKKLHSDACDQVQEYMSMIKSKYKSIGLAASLNGSKVVFNGYICDNGEIREIVTPKKMSINDFIGYLADVARHEEMPETFNTKQRKLEMVAKMMETKLKGLHEHVRNYSKQVGADKIAFINAVLIALRDTNIRNDFEKDRYKDYGVTKHIGAAVNYAISREIIDPHKRHKAQGAFHSLQADFHPNDEPTVPVAVLKNFINTHGVSKVSYTKLIVHYLIEEIIKPIEQTMSDFNAVDISSHIYNEFAKHGNGAKDGQDLGIVLTPQHIAELMVELIDLQPDDILLDICTGTGAFPVEAMRHKGKNAKTEKDEKLVKKNFVAVEQQQSMYTFALANFMFNGMELDNLYLGDCFDDSIIADIEKMRPTKAILNPPYSMVKGPDSTHLHEWNFTKHALSMIAPGGKCAVIIPTSNGIKSDSLCMKLKEELLEEHTLLAIVKCNKNLFLGATPPQVSIYVFEAHRPHDRHTIMIDAEEDGLVAAKNKGRTDSKNLWCTRKRDFVNQFNGINSKYERLDGNSEWEVNVKFDFELTVEDMNENKKSFNSLFKQKKQLSFINTSNWKKFNLADLFEMNIKKSIKSSIGEYPKITGKTSNNGIDSYVSKYNLENMFTIAAVGEHCGTAFWHPYKFFLGQNVNAYNPKFKVTTNIAIFMTTVITKQLKPIFSFYSKTASITRVKQESILLPAKNGEPDWEYMEEFMSSLEI